jgi:hypothetical protein
VKWLNVKGQKDKHDDFWNVLFTDLTEPYMSKFQREKGYSKCIFGV